MFERCKRENLKVFDPYLLECGSKFDILFFNRISPKSSKVYDAKKAGSWYGNKNLKYSV